MARMPPAWAREFVEQARVGHLATTSAGAEPHVIPVCYVLLDDTLYSVIDEKPKSGRRLRRLRNIDETGRASLVVDHYSDDWARLAFVLMYGSASVIPAEAAILDALREKYPQYRSMSLEDSEVVRLRVERWTAWRGS
jgi:PPOX class probable F420-dependent enzyme